MKALKGQLVQDLELTKSVFLKYYITNNIKRSLILINIPHYLHCHDNYIIK